MISDTQISLSFTVALVVTLALGPLIIPLLRRLKFGQSIRDDGPARHLIKAGTPTMGGLMFLAGIALAVLLVARQDRDALVVLGITMGFGLVGFLDDFVKVVLKRSLGLRAREKLLGQILLAALLGALAPALAGGAAVMSVPFAALVAGQSVLLAPQYWLYMLFIIVFTVGVANSVNLTDGLDGLASGVTIAAAAAFIPIGILVGRPGISLVMAALMGGCLGFLFFNRYPARVFMGDTGSLALGGALAAAAVLSGAELALFLIGGVFVLETLSVILQVFFFQVFGRRIFRMSPLHHHFELSGWSEIKVVVVLWLAAVGFAVLGVIGFVTG
ncbi:MAG: phospho-N-acetylmuramoyl-pentapeptide-transferase [Firmicutes bacterium]|nr:phospho-N-acetylmuramoyl-pentapeptide-transferase [Bacillota bacterium]